MPSDYSFRTRWIVPAAPERCWAELERTVTGASGSWWPGLRIVRPAAALRPGAALRIAVRSPLGYGLRCDLRVTDLVPGRSLTADSTGDLSGRGRIRVDPDAAGSRIRFEWDVSPRRAWMRALSPVLRPVFSAAHGLVMRAGERGLRRALARDASGLRNPANPAH
jgi:hypothetical protein